MRHEKNFRHSDRLRVVPVAAVWPQPLAGEMRTRRDAPPALPAPAVPDVPAAVGKLLVCTYAALVGVLFALMARSPLALFSIVIAAGFVAIFFAVPWLFLKVEADPSRRPSFDRFMDRGIDTLTGRTTGKDALVQMLTVPVLVILGLAAMGMIGFVYI